MYMYYAGWSTHSPLETYARCRMIGKEEEGIVLLDDIGE